MSFQDTMDNYDYTAFDEIADSISDTILTEESKKPQKIPLELLKQVSSLDKITFSEIVDVNCLNGLIKSEQLEREFDSNNYSHVFSATIYKNATNQLEEYFNKTYDKKLTFLMLHMRSHEANGVEYFLIGHLGLLLSGRKLEIL